VSCSFLPSGANRVLFLSLKDWLQKEDSSRKDKLKTVEEKVKARKGKEARRAGYDFLLSLLSCQPFPQFSFLSFLIHGLYGKSYQKEKKK
jgi:hypothetical protein